MDEWLKANPTIDITLALLPFMAVLILGVGICVGFVRYVNHQHRARTFVDNYIPEKPDIAEIEAQHPTKMPRWKGWRNEHDRKVARTDDNNPVPTRGH